MTTDIFYGANLKLERANHQIHRLDVSLAQFKAEKLERFYIDFSAGDDLPRHLPTVLGETVHNLRTVLDHFWVACVAANGKKVGKRVQFPFGKSRRNVETLIDKAKANNEAPDDRLCQFILDEIQPYLDGQGHSLYNLNKLDIGDKHHKLIPVVQKFDFQLATTLSGALVKNVTFVTHGLHPAEKVFSSPTPLIRGGNHKINISFHFREETFEGAEIINTLRMLAENIRALMNAVRFASL